MMGTIQFSSAGVDFEFTHDRDGMSLSAWVGKQQIGYAHPGYRGWAIVPYVDGCPDEDAQVSIDGTVHDAEIALGELAKQERSE